MRKGHNYRSAQALRTSVVRSQETTAASRAALIRPSRPCARAWPASLQLPGARRKTRCQGCRRQSANPRLDARYRSDRAEDPCPLSPAGNLGLSDAADALSLGVGHEWIFDGRGARSGVGRSSGAGSFTAARQTVETGMRVCSWENFGTLRRVGPNLALIGLELGFEALLQLDEVPPGAGMPSCWSWGLLFDFELPTQALRGLRHAADAVSFPLRRRSRRSVTNSKARALSLGYLVSVIARP